MNHCIEATEAINSLRSLLGWHPGQRVERRDQSETRSMLGEELRRGVLYATIARRKRRV